MSLQGEISAFCTDSVTGNLLVPLRHSFFFLLSPFQNVGLSFVHLQQKGEGVNTVLALHLCSKFKVLLKHREPVKKFVWLFS